MRVLTALLSAMRVVSAQRPRRIGAREAEALLIGSPTGTDRRNLVRLLAAAAGPARPGELAGEEAAVAAFMRAGAEAAAGAAGPAAHRRRFRPVLTRAMAVKLLAGTAVLSIAGTALAAESGRLPSPVQRQAHDLFAPLGVPAPTKPRGAGHRTRPGPGASTGAHAPVPSARPSSSAASSPAVPVDLCRAFDAGNKDKHGRALDSAAMQALAAAAGGAANIPAYCAKVLADQQTPQPTGSGQSTPAASPTVNPSPSRVNGRGHTPPGKARGHSPAQSSPR